MAIYNLGPVRLDLVMSLHTIDDLQYQDLEIGHCLGNKMQGSREQCVSSEQA